MKICQNGECPNVFEQPQMTNFHDTQPTILSKASFLLSLITKKFQTFQVFSYLVFVQSFNTYLLKAYYVPNTVLFNGGKMVILIF